MGLLALFAKEEGHGRAREVVVLPRQASTNAICD